MPLHLSQIPHDVTWNRTWATFLETGEPTTNHQIIYNNSVQKKVLGRTNRFLSLVYLIQEKKSLVCLMRSLTQYYKLSSYRTKITYAIIKFKVLKFIQNPKETILPSYLFTTILRTPTWPRGILCKSDYTNSMDYDVHVYISLNDF
jgi:hypothetical protein